jgi:hypothetical protein
VNWKLTAYCKTLLGVLKTSRRSLQFQRCCREDVDGGLMVEQKRIEVSMTLEISRTEVNELMFC